MTRRLLILIFGSVAFWLLAASVSRVVLGDRVGGNRAVLYAGTALMLCLLPTSLTLIWGMRTRDQSPEMHLLMVLGGTGVRMAFVLGASLLLYGFVPFYQQTSYWVWVLIFYLFTLALEMVLLAGQSQPKEPGAA